MWGTAICITVLAFSDDILLISMYTLAAVVNSACYIGFFLTPLDIAPSYAGAFMGFSNAISSFVAAFSPIFVGVTVTDLVRTTYESLF